MKANEQAALYTDQISAVQSREMGEGEKFCAAGEEREREKLPGEASEQSDLVGGADVVRWAKGRCFVLLEKRERSPD